MTYVKTIPMLLVSAVLIISIPSWFYFRRPPAIAVVPVETELSKFTSQTVDVSSPQSQTRFSGLICPVSPPQNASANSPGKPVLPVPAPAQASAAGATGKVLPRSLSSLPVVSMISYDGSTRTAIINNQVVKEGSKLEGGVIVRIEEARVLMRKAGKDLWLTTD